MKAGRLIAFATAALLAGVVTSAAARDSTHLPLPAPAKAKELPRPAAPKVAPAVRTAAPAELGPRLPRPRPGGPEPGEDVAAAAEDETDAVMAAEPPAGPDAPETPGESAVVTDAGMPTRLPRPRPAEPGSESAMPSQPNGPASPRAAHAVAAIDMLNRVPRPRPGSATTLALVAPTRQEPPDEAPLAPAVPSASDNACLARLSALGVKFTRLEPTTGACSVAAPLDVTALGSGVAITPQATLNCRTAEALALWVRDSLAPAARIHFNAAPNRIVHDSTYVCRPRNNQRGAQLSEHAYANAVDISAIGFADREPLEIRRYGPSGAKEDRFQLTIRRESCRYFTTVLGPGSNAAHATHFHFDMAERRGGYRLCELGEPNVADRPPAKTERE